jgi:hypothetical protein
VQRPVAILAAVLVIAACSSGSGTAPTTSTTTTSTSSTTTTSTSTTSTTSTTLPPTTTTEPLIVTPGIVKVANASGVQGAATVIGNELAAKGFTLRDPTNGVAAYAKLKVSVIFVVAGSEAVAHSVSRLLGGIEVRPMTIPAWITDGTAGLGDATVLVMLGSDRAKKHLERLG